MVNQPTEASLKSILVVEDDPLNAETLDLVLTQETGYRVRRASTGSEALQAAQQITPDLFLLDVLLPDMNGLHLYDQLRLIPGREAVPTLFLTAAVWQKARIEERGLQIIEKPYDLDQLLSVIMALLRAREAVVESPP